MNTFHEILLITYQFFHVFDVFYLFYFFAYRFHEYWRLLAIIDDYWWLLTIIDDYWQLSQNAYAHAFHCSVHRQVNLCACVPLLLSRQVWTIATVYLDGPRRAYSASSPVSWGLLHDSSWCSLGKVTWPAKSVRGCTGLICRRVCNSSSAASRSGVYTVLLPRIWRVTSLQSAHLRGAHSFDRLPPGYFSSHAPGRWQLAHGHSRFPLLPRGTVSRPVFVILASVSQF